MGTGKSVISKPGAHFAPAAILWVSIFTIYALCPVTTSTDSRWTLYLAMSMIREHDSDLDEYASLMEDHDYRVIYLNDHIYSYFPLGLPCVVTPFVWVVDRVFEMRYSTDLAAYLSEHFPNETTAGIEKIAASFITALAAMLFYLFAHTRLGRSKSFLLTIIFAFSTPLFSTASRALWQHGLSALCLTAFLWIILESGAGRGWMFLGGFLLGFSYVIRPTNSISVMWLTLFVVVRYRKHLVSYLLGLWVPIMILVLNSLQTYQMFLPPYFLPQRLGTNEGFIDALAANLISPNRGLFIASPILLFSMLGIYLQYRKGRISLREIDLYLVLIIALHWIAISSFHNWHGGSSLGPRFFTDVIPYLAYFLIPVLEDGRFRTSRGWRIVFGLAALVSMLIHARYVTSIYPMLWNQKPVALIDAPQRVWDWNDLQMLRGLCTDKVEGRFPGCWLTPE
ncbi:MAG: hypothetical protein HGA28_08195 [Anaerolineaceae bacterium]|nr:hypothetical protein [Anaerolineaceae bacterium]